MTTIELGNGIEAKRLHLEGNSPAFDASGVSDSIVWVVNTTPVDMILSSKLATLGAIRGVVHPDIPAIVVNSTKIIPTGHGCKITVEYRLPEFLDTTVENDQDLGWWDMDATFEGVSLDIPVFQKVTKTFSSVGPPAPIFQPVERIKKFQYKRVVNRITINAEIPALINIESQFALTEYINQQNNKLHKIGGRWYVFEADGLRRLSEGLWQFTYRWSSDPGVPNTLDLPIEGDFAVNETEYYPLSWKPGDGGFSEFVPDPQESWIKLPHHRLDTGMSDSPSTPPAVAVAPQFLVGSNTGDGDGYTLLPGVISV